jgi:mono/diheme cytochrome c family protein
MKAMAKLVHAANALVLATLALAGCQRVAYNIDFERMIDQAKFEAYEADVDAPDRTVMREPPAGTVPREPAFDPWLTAVRDASGAWRRDIPLTIDRSLLERGRDRYERFCGACHGVTGHGNGPVVENMSLRPAPSLHQADIKAQPPGQIFSTITHGFGLMPSYANELELSDRWAVVAYLRALWISQEIELAALPSYLRAMWLDQQTGLARVHGEARP